MDQKSLSLEWLATQADYVFGSINWSHDIMYQINDYVEEREDGTVLVGCSTFVKICLRSGKFHQGIGFHESISNTIGEATMQARTISFNQAFYNALMFFKEMRDHLAQEEFKKQERLKKQLKMKLEWEKKN